MVVELMTMNKVDVPVASSLDVAETFGKDHKEIIRAIEGQLDAEGRTKHLSLLAELTRGGVLHLENFFIPAEYERRGKKYRQYFMTRDGFVLLVMGFNGERAMKFKLDYINQFNAMEKALNGKIKEREKGIAVRQALTKAIQVSSENERMHGHAYSTYTDVIYRSIFNKTAKQLREDYKITKDDSLRDCFTEEELNQIRRAEMLVSSLVEYGWGYNEIKDFINTQAAKRIEEKSE